MNIIRLTTACVLAAWMPAASVAEIAPIGKDLEFRVKLTSALDSRQNRKGDKTSAIVLSPAQFKGATMEGQVDEAKSSGKVNKQSTLKFTFSNLILPDGETVAISSVVRSYKNSKGKEGVDEEGNIIEKRGNTSKVAAATGVAALAGAVWGGGKGTLIGAGAGLVGALIVVSIGTKAPAIAFASGSELEMSVSDLRVR